MATAAAVAHIPIVEPLQKDVEVGHGLSVYKCGNLVVTPGLSDRALAGLYEMFDQQGILDRLFYNEPVSLFGFLQAHLNSQAVNLGCWLEDEQGKWIPWGLQWINETKALGEFRRADVGMAYLKGISYEQAFTFGCMGVEWVWDHLTVDVLGGVTPAANRAAVLYSKRLGFQCVGPVDAACVWEGKLAPAFISTLVKEDWAARRPWKES